MIIADCTFALPSIWLWDSIYIYCWVQIANIFLRVFVSVFMRCVGLQSSCAVSVWFCFQEASWKGRSGFWELTSSGRACPQAWKHSSTPSSLRVLTEVEEPEARTCTDLIIWHKLRAEADWPNKILSLTTAGLGRPCMQFTANFRKRFQTKRKQQINSQGWFLPSLFFNNLNINTS